MALDSGHLLDGPNLYGCIVCVKWNAVIRKRVIQDSRDHHAANLKACHSPSPQVELVGLILVLVLGTFCGMA